MAKRRAPEFHYYDWDFNRWFGSKTRAFCRALGGLKGQAAAGVYRELLDYCYKDGSIPSDIGGLAALAGLSVEDFETLWPTFKRKFQAHKKDPARLINREVEARRRAWKQKRISSALAGVKSGQKRGMHKANDDTEISNDRSTEMNARSISLNQEEGNRKEEIGKRKKEVSAEASASPHGKNGTGPVTTKTQNPLEEFARNRGKTDFDWFTENFPGEIPDSTHRAFVAYVNTPELLAALKRNMPLWMRTAKYRSGAWQNAVQYLKGGTWKTPPPASMLSTGSGGNKVDPFEAAQ